MSDNSNQVMELSPSKVKYYHLLTIFFHVIVAGLVITFSQSSNNLQSNGNLTVGLILLVVSLFALFPILNKEYRVIEV